MPKAFIHNRLFKKLVLSTQPFAAGRHQGRRAGTRGNGLCAGDWCNLRRLTLKIKASAEPDAHGGYAGMVEIGEAPDQVYADNIKDIIDADARLEVRLTAQCVGG